MTPELPVIDLGYRPRTWQGWARRQLRRYNVLVVHRRGGKTVLALRTMIDAALRTRKQMARYRYVAPLRKQAKGVAWDYLKAFTAPIPGIKISEAELSVTLPNGARIELVGADDPDALRGLYFDGVVIDEVAQAKPSVWGEVIYPALTDRNGWCIFIGTPKGVNLLSERYYAAVQSDGWTGILLTVHDTDVYSPAQIAELRRTMTETQFRQEFECDFSASSENQLIMLDDVLTAQNRSARDTDYAACARIMGVDVARQGNDRSAIAMRQGPLLHPLKVYRGLDNVELAVEVARTWAQFKPSAVFIDNSPISAGVIDHLRHFLKYKPIPIDFGGTKNMKPGYGIKRDEMWGEMAEWVRQEACLPDDPDLRLDLCTPTYSFGNARNVMQVESKDKLRDRGLPSPDLGDAIALTFAMPVAAPRHPEWDHLRNRGQGATIFDDHGPRQTRQEGPWRGERAA